MALLYIFIIFICVAYPVLLFIIIWFLPWYVIVSYFIWYPLSLLSVVFSKGKKWYDKMMFSIFITLIFTFILIVGFNSNGMFNSEKNGGNILICFMMTALNLPAIYYIGNKLRTKLYQKNITNIKVKIEACEKEIQQLEVQLKDKVMIIDLLMLIDNCGTDVSIFKNCSQLNKTTKLKYSIIDKKAQLKQLKIKLQNIVENE